MFKFIIILVLVVFLFSRLFKFLLKYAFIGMAQKQATGNFNQNQYSAPNTDNNSGKVKAKKFNSGNKDGEYIDYEIIK
ncbi:MAG: hypothetical protein ACKVOU_04995 [Cytophagales bacterium]